MSTKFMLLFALLGLVTTTACEMTEVDDVGGGDADTDADADTDTDSDSDSDTDADLSAEDVNGSILFDNDVNVATCYHLTQNGYRDGKVFFNEHAEILSGQVPSSNRLSFRGGAIHLEANESYFYVNCFVDLNWFLIDTRVDAVDQSNGIDYLQFGTVSAPGYSCSVVEKWIPDFDENDEPTDITVWDITYHAKCSR